MPNKYLAQKPLPRIFNSVITRLLCVALGIVILGSFLRYYVLSDFLRQDLGTVAEQQQLALATYVARDIDGKIISRQVLLDRIAASLPLNLLSQPEALRAWLKERFVYQTLFSSGLYVIGMDGKNLADYPIYPERERTDFSQRDYFKSALSGSSYIGRPRVGTYAKVPILPIAVPIKNANGDVMAVLVGSTILSGHGFLDSLLQSRGDNVATGFMLVSPRDQLFVASSQTQSMLSPLTTPGADPMLDQAMKGFRGVGIAMDDQGVEQVSAMVSVPSAGWLVVSRMPTSIAFATIGRLQHFLIKNATIATSFFMLLACAGLYFVLGHLFRAAECADRMSRGEIPLEPLPVHREDEVGHLISAFNRLLLKLDENQDELKRLAHTDTLTGLPNRVHLSERLPYLLAQARANGSQVGLLFMDLDGFKDINDSMGHEAGDEVLREVAARFNDAVREADTLARIGGDEFILLLSGLGSNAELVAGTVAARCIASLEQPFCLFNKHCRLGVSIGIAISDGANTSDELLLAADRVMYQAKKMGRGRYVTHTLEMG
jgi:diguanylate cyclase (GGDEF)-like protein